MGATNPTPINNDKTRRGNIAPMLGEIVPEEKHENLVVE
jgi:hypothetical protein